MEFRFHVPFLSVVQIEVIDMREKNKQVGYSCYEKKQRGFENPKEKYKRWKRNIKFFIVSAKYFDGYKTIC